MALLEKVKAGQMFIGRLAHGADLLDELTQTCSDRNIRCGRIEAIGAVQSARIAYYDQQKQEYGFLILEEALEITALIGNVSLKDGAPMVHAHITLADEHGKAYGGHLAHGTTVFACEFMLQAFESPILEREFDSETGLPLWAIRKQGN
jgi:uncharacterized protein